MKLANKNGFSLVEVILATAILAFALVGILGTYVTCLVLITTSQNVNAATNATQGIIEEIRSTPFTQVIDNYNGLVFTVNDIPTSIGVVYVDDTLNAEFLDVTVSVCWRQGNRIIGEDANLNGVLDSGEDTMIANGIIDSPVQLKTQVANK
jgi:prepilin-type N-terminal cleavage/methylation domain-containing protein